VEPLAGEAWAQDERLARRARRRARKGGGSAAVLAQLEQVERPAAWAPVHGALAQLAACTARLSAFLEAEVSDAAAAHLAAALPAVVGRAVCDWHYQGHAAELEQLEGWWSGARAALQKQEVLWERLLVEDGIFVRRIDRGIEALFVSKQRYEALADFGACEVRPGEDSVPTGEWPKERMALLAQAVAEIRSRVRPIRDSAAWHVVDVAKIIQRKLREEEAQRRKEASPWASVSLREGAKALCQALEVATGYVDGGEAVPGDPVDAALVFMQRLDRLACLVGELRDTFAGPADGGLGDVLEEILQAAASISEELLVVMDDPNAASVGSWARQWSQWGQTIGGQKIESAMAARPAQADTAMKPAERVVRRRQLTLLRGVQALLDDPGLRRLVATAPGIPASPTGAAAARAAAAALCEGMLPEADEDGAAATAALTLPPSESAAASGAPASPRGASYVARRPRKEVAGHEEPQELAPGPSAGEEAAAPAEAAAAPEELLQEAPPPPLFESRPNTASVASSRPCTPSWLRPPWQRPDTPSAASWTRPDTPSTVCDDAEVAPMPRWKCVDGQYVPLKSTSSHGRLLPPLQVPAPSLPSLGRGL